MTPLVRNVPCKHPPLPRGLSRALLAAHAVATVTFRFVFIGIPVALLMWFCAVIVGPHQHRCGESKGDIAGATVKKYAFEAYPAWLAAHPHERCPRALDQFDEYMNNQDTIDPWGSPYSWYCVAATDGPSKLVVISIGEDGRADTADDLRSD